MNKRYPIFALMVGSLLTGYAYAADELDLLGQPPVRSERTIRSEQQVLWTLPFETTRYIPEQATPAMRDAMAAQQAGRYLEAIAILEEAKGESTLPDNQLLRAGFYLQGDQARYAQEILTALLQQSPQSAEAHALMAMAYLQQGQLDPALSAVQRAQSLGDRPLVTRIFTYVLQARGKLERASDVMAAHNANSPADALGLAREAELALNLGDQPRATARIEAARGLDPQSPYVVAVSGLVWLIEDKPEQAQGAFERALQHDPEDAKALLGLGLAKARQGRLEESLEQLRKAARAEPASAMIQTYLGRALHQAGRFKEAQIAYQSAIRLDPQDPAPWIYLAQSQTEMGRPGDALNSLNKAAERKVARAVYRGQYLLNEDEQTLQANRAEAYGKLGLHDMAWFALTDGAGEKNAVTLKNQAETLQNLKFGQTARRSLALQSLFNDAVDALPVTLDVYGDGAGQAGASAPQHGVVENLSGQQASYGDYGALFATQTHVQLDGIVGNRQTWGEQIRGAAGGGQFGFSLAQLHYETEGFSAYNNLDNTTWEGVLKWDLLDSTRLFLSYKNFRSDRSDVFFPQEPYVYYAPSLIKDENWLMRLGLRHLFGNGGELRALLSRQRTDQTIHDLIYGFDTLLPNGKADSAELQYRQTNRLGLFVAGVQAYREEADFFNRYFDAGEFVTYLSNASKIKAGQVYAAQKVQLDEHWLLDMGLGWSRWNNQGNNIELRRWTPRVGLSYRPAPETQVYLALEQHLGLPQVGGASLAPVETAGIVQDRQVDAGKLVRSAGLGFNHRLSKDWLVGGEAQVRQAREPLTTSYLFNEYTQREGKLKFDWIPAGGRIAAGLNAGYERRVAPNIYERLVLDSVQEQHLRDLILSVSWFMDNRLSLKGEVSRNWVDGEYQAFFPPSPYRDASTQINASLQWKLPQGKVEFGVRNLLDDDFEYTESDPLSPRFSKGRLIYGSARLSW